jgi:hypothetical protein
MTSYTFSQARQKFASLLDRARDEGRVLIRRKDGTEFEVRPVRRNASPLDVKGVKTRLTAAEIVRTVREMRER